MKLHQYRFITPLLIALAVASCDSPASSADMVLVNGVVASVDDENRKFEAVAVKGDRILAVGSTQEIRDLAGPGTEVIDLQGRLAIPGFIEGHGHFTGIGTGLTILDARPQSSWAEIVELVRSAAEDAQAGEWITGRGWHQDKWDTAPAEQFEGFPTMRTLSEAAPENPVLLRHASGHASIANAKALEMAGVTKDTPNPVGGEILKDENGNLTGLLRETAQRLVGSVVTQPETPEEKAAHIERLSLLAGEEALRNGITSFHDAGASFEEIDVFKSLAEQGDLPVRLYVMIRQPNELLEQNLADYRMVDYGDGHLTVRSIKLSIDGALGSRGAWLHEPYSDAPHLTGLNLIPIESVHRTAELALEHDYQLGIHAIGDRANTEVLDIFSDAYQREDTDDLRWRIEHAQHLTLEDIPRFGRLGVIASMQAVHCTSDAPWVPDRLGDKRSSDGAYVWQKLMQSGAVVTNGTDAPVEDVSPIASYFSSVTREMNDGERFYPDQRMSRDEGLRAYTINNAYAAFEEDTKGSIEIGKLADITVLSQDILTVEDDMIPETQVDLTIVGGEIRYDRRSE